MDKPKAKEEIKKLEKEPEDIADDIANKVIDVLGQRKTIQHLRHSQFLTSMVAAAGIALVLVGIEKLFINLSGWFSVILGLFFLAISGTLYQKLS